MSAALRVRTARVQVDGRRVIDGVDLDVPTGALTVVTGPSGAGKSTLLAVASGLLTPDEGAATLDGRPLAGVHLDPGRWELARRIGVVLQGYGLVPVLARASDRLVEELSGGQQQRVAVARALAPRPDVVVADEPTAERDQAWRVVVMDLLRSAASGGAAVLLASHDDEVVTACDGGTHLVDGVAERSW